MVAALQRPKDLRSEGDVLLWEEGGDESTITSQAPGALCLPAEVSHLPGALARPHQLMKTAHSIRNSIIVSGNRTMLKGKGAPEAPGKNWPVENW